MAPGWSDVEQAALMSAWEKTNDESGKSDDIYRHFLDLCELEPPKSKSVVILRKQTLVNMCRLIVSIVSLKPDSGGEAAINSEREREQVRVWFRLSLKKRKEAFEHANTSSYGFVDVDETTFWSVQRRTAGVHMIKSAPRHDWDRDELFALLQAHKHALNEPPRRRQCSVESLTYRRFVSRCAGEVKRSLQATATKLAAMLNMISVIKGHNEASRDSCTACYAKNNWFALSPAERKASFDERNSSPHRFLDLDETLFNAAERAVNQDSQVAEQPSQSEQPRDGGDPAATAATVLSSRSCCEESETESVETRTDQQAAEQATETMQTASVVRDGDPDREPPVLEEPSREQPTCGPAMCPHHVEQQEATAAWQNAHEIDLAATKLALAELKTELQQQHDKAEERDRKRKHECDQALLDLSAKFEATIESLRAQFDEERSVHSAALGFLRDRVESEATKREQLVDQVRVLDDDQSLHRQAELKTVGELGRTLLLLEKKLKAAAIQRENRAVQQEQQSE